MSQRSCKHLYTLSKHMTNDTNCKLIKILLQLVLLSLFWQLLIQTQPLVKYMLIVQLIIGLFIKIMHGFKLFQLYKLLQKLQRINIILSILHKYARMYL